MSRRARAIAFGVVAAICAAVAATIADGYGANVANQFGELRPVVVSGGELRPGAPLGPGDLRGLEVRRVPARFAPPDALASPEEAVGREPAAPVPPGSYLLASQLRAPRSKERAGRPPLERGRRPVEIAVTGAQALGAVGDSPEGSSVDVVVTTEPGPGAKGRTYVAAEGVELLALREGGGGLGADESGLGAGGDWSATLALTRAQSLELIQAENFARQVRLLPR
ncbi:MAG: SAF domain-containing protein [Solirubrobacterales bacterium]